MRRLLGLFLLLCLLASSLQAQKKKTKINQLGPSNTAAQIDDTLFDMIQWRPIGPWRGGRSGAVTGVPGKPNLYYFGAAGGGVWRTQDGGQSWGNISDGFFGGSIGAIAVSASDPNVIYAGGGEQTVRGNVSSGYGMWKSVDAGKTWKQIGLKDSRHIARIRIHPQNPDLLYVASMGNLYKANDQRGVFRSKDGGETWEKILFANADAGAVDLTFDPNNPRILYVSTWRIRRTPYSLSSGGEGSALWKSTDAGDTWENLMEKKGMPKDTIGIIGVTVSPVNSERVWALIESKDGGIYRSEDAGETWKKINSERKLRQRAWYYTRIYADTEDEDVLYVMNVQYHKSKDGGKTFSTEKSPHGDHHDLWIAPENPNRMIIGDDGGAQVSYNGGKTWTTYHNQPTAQFYRVTTDNAFPYRIYVAQQDNSTVRIAHRTSGGSIGERDWEPTAGCECGHIAIDPEDNEIVYGGCYDGFLSRKNHRTDQNRIINVWPDNPMGHGVEAMKYRFQWNFPLFFSPHDPDKLYTASNYLHVTTNEGQSWETISPDLTRDDKSKQGSSGGPITQDNTSVEYYCTIFAAAESPRVKDLLWTGSDDGLIHVSKDGGKNWENITPSNLPEWSLINSLEPDPFNDGGCYMAATRYKLGDFKPYLYHTTDYGKTWHKITNGIDQEHFTRVVRADPKRQGLLYAGTETGMYISWDNGQNWQSMQLNLPIVPITDLAIKNDNLVAATQGRSIWMIDDLSIFQQLKPELIQKEVHLYKPLPAYRMSGAYNKKVKGAGMNHPNGVMVNYYLKELSDSTEVKIGFYEKDGDLIKEYSTKAPDEKKELKLKDLKPGANQFIWNMYYPGMKKFDGMILWWASTNGPRAVPSQYTVKLTVDDQILEENFEILQDPRPGTSLSDLQTQFDFRMAITDKVTEAHEAIIDIRNIRTQFEPYKKRFKDKEDKQPLVDMMTAIDSTLSVVEKALYQTKNRSGQDPLNFPIRLTNKLAHLNSITQNEYKPTDQMVELKEELVKEIDDHLAVFEKVVKEELPRFNQMMRESAIDAIMLDKE